MNELSDLVEITLADGSALMLNALSELFEEDGRFSLLSTTATAESFLQTALSVPSLVAVIDWGLPALGAERLIQILREQESPMRVVVCTQGSSLEIAKRAMSSGAAGYYSHNQPTDILIDTVLKVAGGKMVFPYLDVRDLHDPLQALTRTELALLTSLSQGRTNKELAADHKITINTVKFHLRNMYDKLSVNNRAQAIAYFYSASNPSTVERKLDQN